MTPSFSLAGKTAFVTGASSGLGAHFARVLATAGARVAITARRVDRLDALAGTIRAAGGAAHPIALDVTDPAAVPGAFAAAESALGPIDIVINNAGVPSESWFLKTTEQEWRDVMAVNLDGVFRVGQEGARRMVAAGRGGSIVNIASILGTAVMKTLAPYAASKAAVISLTKSMALELAREKIRVNALAPGYFATEINAAFWASGGGQKMIRSIPFGRIGDLSELDGPLLLLASDAGAFMSGSVLTVDGGHLLATG
jgi:NAD(P)-dependent dehydrogenase (short-subunit alcohol dehydrogenase family)